MTTDGIPRAVRESARGWNSSLPVRKPGTITAALMGGSSDAEGDGVLKLKAPTNLHLFEIMVRTDASQRQRESSWRGMAMLGILLQ